MARGALGLLIAAVAFGQSTEGIVSGRVYDEATGRAIESAAVSALHVATGSRSVADSAGGGRYAIPALSPGLYFVRATAPGYQSRETNDLEVYVSGRLELDIPLRLLTREAEASSYSPAYLPGAGAYVHTYTADIETTRVDLLDVVSGLPGLLEASLSYVLTPREVDALPLPARDLYSTLALQPGVASYAGTARGLGLSVQGQRPSSTNFLLDGVENNNSLTTGPLTTIAPEGIREYRISTHNFSAEYGRTGGVIANAVSQSGSAGWHGLIYSYFRNNGLNANGFQENQQGIPRAALHETELGAVLTGALGARLFLSTPFDYLRFRGRNDPVKWILPTREFIQSLPSNTAGSYLLRTYALAVAPSAPGQTSAKTSIASPVTLDRYSAVPRLDYVTSGEGRQHFFGRSAFSQLRQPDLLASPYPAFSSPFRFAAGSLAFGHILTRPGMANELRVAAGGNSTRVDRIHSEVPFSTSMDHAALPGSPTAQTFRNSPRDLEALDNFSWLSGRSFLKFGGGVLRRRITTFANISAGGQYTFEDLNHYVLDQPMSLLLSYDRSNSTSLTPPPFDREYSYTQFYLFAQQSLKLSRRLQVNYGFRYEYLGAPKSAGGGHDYLISLGSGASLPERLSQASWSLGTSRLYSSSTGDPAVRAGWAFDVTGRGQTLLKGGYGIFYDRIYDNLWQNVEANRLRYAYSNFTYPVTGAVNQLQPPYTIASQYPATTIDDPLPPVLFQPNLRDPRVQHFFMGVQQRLPGNSFFEVAYSGSLASQLYTTDRINRPFSTEQTAVNPQGLWNPALPADLSYFANQGKSSYHALTATLRFQTRWMRGQASYTLSHSIDVQSDPLAGDFLDFNFFNAQRAKASSVAAFTRQFDDQANRASSDFDQRHNFVFYGVSDLPAAFGNTRFSPLFRDWHVAAMGAIRSGFPYTVFASPSKYLTNGVEYLYNNPADLLNMGAARISTSSAGGRELLNPEAFATPAAGRIGNAGRNSFTGPGLVSIDLSLSRTLRLPHWERALLTIRCDANNALNHVNLGNPVNTTLGLQGFGMAYFGRTEQNPGLPLLTPFSETGRTLRIMFRLAF